MNVLKLILLTVFYTLFSALQIHAQSCGWLVEPGLLPLYEGHYEFHEKRILHITHSDGILWGEMTGLSQLKLTPSGQHEFYFTDIDAHVVFNVNKKGTTSSLDFTRGDKKTANKIALNNKTLKKKVLKKYVGDYRISEESIISVFSEEGHLYARYNNEILTLIPLRKDLFYSPSSVMKIGFNVDFDDNIKSITLYVGQALEFQKMI